MQIEAEPKQELLVFGISDQAIAECKQKYSGLIISDNKSYEATKAARTHVKSLRTDIEKMRKELGKPLHAQLAKYKQEADRLTVLIRAIEDPLQKTVSDWENKKKAEKAEKARVEQERIEGHKSFIRQIRNLGDLVFAATVNDIQHRMEELHTLVVDSSLEEFEIEAGEAKQASQSILEDALIYTKNQEEEQARLKEEREELEREKEELAKIKESKKFTYTDEFLADWDAAIIDNQEYDSKHSQMNNEEILEKYMNDIHAYAKHNAPKFQDEEMRERVKRLLAILNPKTFMCL